jgi:DNA-binding MarR family transcriptional regulator
MTNGMERSPLHSQASKGLTLSDLMLLPDDERRLVNTMKRQLMMSLEELALQLEESPTAIASLLDRLIQKGFVSKTGDPDNPSYQVCFSPKRARQIPTKLMQLDDD